MFRVWIVAAVLMLSCFAATAQDSQKPYGIEKRLPWATSRMKGTPEPPPPYLIERAFEGLMFKNPVELVAVPGTDQLAMLEVDGNVWTFPASGAAERQLAANVKEIEGVTRVYGLAFHPNFERNRHVFLCYVLDAENPQGTIVGRYRATSVDPLKIDLKSEEAIIRWKSGGHNGGSLKFGPHDGLFYISTGDGGPAFPPDPSKTGQDIGDLLASTLRIDVDHPEGDRLYSIPDDNPFVGVDGARGEVWSYGHRNPWRMSFDPATGDLWVGDVGWELWEMIYRVKPGDNYGWSLLEHTQAVHPERPRGPTPIVPPTIAHSHTESRSITGGFVYRGKRLPALVGTYIYGDYVTGKIWGAKVGDDGSVGKPVEIVDSSVQVICFGVDHDQELYMVGYDGSVHRFVPNPEAGRVDDFPQTLSRSGLFKSTGDHTLAAGVIPYAVNAEPWADGTTAERFVALPGTSKLGVHTENNVQKGNLRGEWQYPDGSVLGKTISLEMKAGDPSSRRRLETQILYRYRNRWRSYSYLWNDEQTDAELSPGTGFDRVFQIEDAEAPKGRRQLTWHFASRTECLLCHTTRGGSVYGFKPGQLNRDFDYGKVTDNQLRTMAHIGLFEEPLSEGGKPTETRLDRIPKTVNPHDGGASIPDRVRSYLHVNCAHCHRRGGGGTAAIDVQQSMKLNQTHLVSRPTQGTFGILDPWLIEPGDPYRSVLFYRMAKVGKGRMPHFGSKVVDVQGLRLMHDWIEQLSADRDSLNATPATPEQVEAVKQMKASTESALLLLTDGIGVSDSLKLQAIDRLLSSTSSALLLSTVVRGFGRELDASLYETIIARGVAHPDPVIRDIFEPFIPEDQRVKRLGNEINAQQILVLQGDSVRGRQLYFRTEGTQCRNCHKVGNEGKSIGPELTTIGKRLSRAEILENILEPSKKIDPKFQTWLLETSQGKIHSGLLVSRSKEAAVLRDATGKDVRINGDDIELLIPQKKSLMPELQLKDMTAQEVADLLSFLSSLK